MRKIDFCYIVEGNRSKTCHLTERAKSPISYSQCLLGLLWGCRTAQPTANWQRPKAASLAGLCLQRVQEPTTAINLQNEGLRRWSPRTLDLQKTQDLKICVYIYIHVLYKDKLAQLEKHALRYKRRTRWGSSACCLWWISSSSQQSAKRWQFVKMLSVMLGCWPQ